VGPAGRGRSHADVPLTVNEASRPPPLASELQEE
jgi:hypothetical protein